MAEEEESESGSSEESEVEWEDVDPVASILNGIYTEEINLPKFHDDRSRISTCLFPSNFVAPEPSLEQLEALKDSQNEADSSQSTTKPQTGSLEIVLERKAQGKKYNN